MGLEEDTLEDKSTIFMVLFIATAVVSVVFVWQFFYIILRLCRRVWYKKGLGAMILMLALWPSLFVYWARHRSEAGLRSLRRHGAIALVSFIVGCALQWLAEHLLK